MRLNSRQIPPMVRLLAFESAARLGSLTHAANELCVSPTAVSKQIQALETFLDTTLFTRSKQGVSLTNKGEQYLLAVTPLLHAIADETEKMQSKPQTHLLNVEVGLCFSHFWLLPRLESFRQQYPNISLNLNINNERYVGDNENYDIAFYYSPVDSLNKNNHLLFNERISLVCSPSFLSDHPECVDMQNIFNLPIIMLRESLPSWVGWQEWLDEMGLEYQEPGHVFYVDDQVAVIQAALNGVGIALAWDWHVRELLATDQLIELSKPIEFIDKAYFLSVSDSCDKNLAQIFTDWVIEEERCYLLGSH